ncbi:hypothetical protein [Synoicihabitans lomoniglobus]|uniref:Uncharacterized protein n=1 Tax=Synoicihabitans lomoniglobus TaxID=2909285 RepID=A0AAE9ZV93_9BACT|nr:hypothetical protein [Opitutaceae bacterium LMO-M01]WED64737.1 hypothetical protein PXH66_20530 [Opitutaceae bacterium LMO-M01]
MVRFVTGIVLVIAGGSVAWAAPLRARMGDQNRTVMQVMGIDAAGRIRLRPEATDAGEALLPLDKARDLRFILPDDYREAQQLIFAGRHGEALLRLRRIVPELVPYAGIAGSNAVPVVRRYFRLLVSEGEWADALAVASSLPFGEAETDFVPEIVGLARALQAQKRMKDVAWLLERLPLDTSAGAHRALVWELADEMRREGFWAESQTIYQRLRGAAAETEQLSLDLLLAYTDWHQGSDLRASALVTMAEMPTTNAGDGALFRLLAGRVRLAQDDPAGALDVLSEGLIGIDGASEWRVELTAVMASAYRETGDDDIAAGIERDLRRLYPDSRWLPHSPD